MPIGQGFPAFFDFEKRTGVNSGVNKWAFLQEPPALCRYFLADFAET